MRVAGVERRMSTPSSRAGRYAKGVGHQVGREVPTHRTVDRGLKASKHCAGIVAAVGVDDLISCARLS